MQIKHIDARPAPTLESQRTVIWVDPRDRTCGVYVKRSSEGTPVDEYYDLVLTHSLNFHPHEETLHQWFAVNEPELDLVCAGHEVYFDGNTHRGRLNEEAADTWRLLVDDLNGYEGDYSNYEVWDVRDWMQFTKVEAHMTDEELAQLVAESTPLESDKEVIVGDIGDYLRAVRAAKQDEEVVA